MAVKRTVLGMCGDKVRVLGARFSKRFSENLVSVICGCSDVSHSQLSIGVPYRFADHVNGHAPYVAAFNAKRYLCLSSLLITKLALTR